MLSRKVRITDIIFWCINIIFISIFIIWSGVYWDDRSLLNDYTATIFTWICILGCTQIVSFYLKGSSVYDFGIWFSLFSYLFMFGYIFRDYFALSTTLLWNPVTSYSKNDLFHSYLYIIVSLEMFSLGYLLTRQNDISRFCKIKEKLEPDKECYVIGKIFFAIGSLFTLVHDIPIIFFLQSANSYAEYSGAVSSGISGSLSLFMLPGVFFLIFSGTLEPKKIRLLVLGVLVYLLIYMILTGSRKVQIFSIVSLLIGYSASKSYHRFSITKYLRLISMMFGTFFMLTLLVTIREYRFYLDRVVDGLLDNLTSFNIVSLLAGEIIAETGLTGLSVASIISVVPDQLPYQYGMTLIRTIPSILPIGWLAKDFFNQAASTYVINLYTGIPVGSSMFGDLYWNWGYLGIIGSFICGIFFKRLLKLKPEKINYRFQMALYFSLFSILIILVRSEFFDVFRPVTYVFLGIFCIKNFMKLKR